MRISGPCSGSADQRTSGSADQRTSGSADQRITDQRISGSADQRTQRSGSADPADQRTRIRGSAAVQRISGSDNPTIISLFIWCLFFRTVLLAGANVVLIWCYFLQNCPPSWCKICAHLVRFFFKMVLLAESRRKMT